MADMNEKDLERIAGGLGRAAGERIDVERTARAVISRLRTRETPRMAAWWATPGLLKIAAAVTLTIGAGLFGYQSMNRSVTPASDSVAFGELQALSSDELEEVFDSLAVEAPAHQVAVGLHDLDDEQLTQLLQRMEG
jgi:hypothetical protein